MFKLYQRIKNCLISPGRIASYANEKTVYTIIHVLILSLIIAIVPLISVINQNTVDYKYGQNLASQLKTEVRVDFEIKNNELVRTTTSTATPFVVNEVNYGFGIIPVVIAFSDTDDIPAINVEFNSYLLMMFNKNNFGIYLATNSDSSSNGGQNTGKIELAIKTSGIKLFSKSYADLKINDVQFFLTSLDDYEFTNSIYQLINSIYSYIKTRLLPVIIIIIITGSISSFLISALIIALFEKIMYRMLGLSFGKIFKIVLLCSLPYAICSLLAAITGLIFLDYVGMILMIFYTVRAMGAYKFIYSQQNEENK